MSASNLSSKSMGAGVFAAILASLCCITPVISLLAGVSGIAATFSWMEPYRPWLIALTVGALGFAWYQKLLTKPTEDMDCTCEEDKPSFWQSNKFLGIVTVFATLMLAFPSYSHIFYSNTNQNAMIMTQQDSTTVVSMEVKVKGMTCGGCESHIENEVGKLLGIKRVDASYSAGTTSVEYVISKINEQDIIATINQTGYSVVGENQMSSGTGMDSDDVTFYQVPLVCNAAPTIGCGSCSKPILKSLEASEEVKAAWLYRKGTVIAVVWNEGVADKTSVASRIFTKNKLEANLLLLDDHADHVESFKKGDGWYKGSDVDKLSKKEAGIIADQLMIPIAAKTEMSAADQQKMKEKMVDRIYDFFLNYKSMDELGDPKVYKSMIFEFIDYGEGFVGKGNMPTQDELRNACSSASKNCDHKGGKSSCCSSKKS